MQNSQDTGTFDFDAWAALAKVSPANFNELRQLRIEEVILKYGGNRKIDQRKLRGLQWRIDMEITKAHTPLKSCLCLSSMMWDSFLEMRDALELIVVECRKSGMRVVSSQTSAKLDSASAKILPFCKRSDTP